VSSLVDDWITTTLGDFASLQRGHVLPEPASNPGDIPVMGSFGITGSHSVSSARGPGVTVGRSGASIRVVSYIDCDYWQLNTCLYVTDFHGNNPRFVYYFLKTLDLASFNSGSAQPSLNRNDIYPVEIDVPQRTEQDAIATLLRALDDKIELNRQTNETLEALARALFKEWFVDFGPTRTKAEGGAPYLAPELWALFPDALDDEDKPVGWEVRPLDEIARFLNGLALQKYPAKGNEYLPVIKIAELRSGITEKSGKASVDLPSDYVVRDGDVLFSWSGSLTQLVWTGGDGALNQHLFKVTSEKFPKWFFYHWVEQHLPDFRAIAASKATTMGHIQRRHLSESETVIPDKALLNAADALIAPLFAKRIENNLESRTLAQTRDLLLPKLISGEIRLRDAEREVEAVL
jgi:type I restriction enzyme S subunit